MARSGVPAGLAMVVTLSWEFTGAVLLTLSVLAFLQGLQRAAQRHALLERQ